jgi:hypothetical protein
VADVADVAERDGAWLRSDESAKWWGNNAPRLDGALGALASQFGGTLAGEFSKTQFGELRDHLHSLTKADGKTQRKPVARWVVDATLPYLSSPVVALVELMWLTPARNCRARLFGAR